MAHRTALLILHSKSIDDATGRLPSPEADLPALAAALGDEAIGGFEVTKLIDDTVQAMREAIVRLFRSVGPQDVALFYYAGNALQDQFGEVYLTARDTRPEALEATGQQVGDPGGAGGHRPRSVLDLRHRPDRSRPGRW